MMSSSNSKGRIKRLLHGIGKSTLQTESPGVIANESWGDMNHIDLEETKRQTSGSLRPPTYHSSVVRSYSSPLLTQNDRVVSSLGSSSRPKAGHEPNMSNELKIEDAMLPQQPNYLFDHTNTKTRFSSGKHRGRLWGKKTHSGHSKNTVDSPMDLTKTISPHGEMVDFGMLANASDPNPPETKSLGTRIFSRKFFSGSLRKLDAAPRPLILPASVSSLRLGNEQDPFAHPNLPTNMSASGGEHLRPGPFHQPSYAGTVRTLSPTEFSDTGKDKGQSCYRKTSPAPPVPPLPHHLPIQCVPAHDDIPTFHKSTPDTFATPSFDFNGANSTLSSSSSNGLESPSGSKNHISLAQSGAPKEELPIANHSFTAFSNKIREFDYKNSQEFAKILRSRGQRKEDSSRKSDILFPHVASPTLTQGQALQKNIMAKDILNDLMNNHTREKRASDSVQPNVRFLGKFVTSSSEPDLPLVDIVSHSDILKHAVSSQWNQGTQRILRGRTSMASANSTGNSLVRFDQAPIVYEPKLFDFPKARERFLTRTISESQIDRLPERPKPRARSTSGWQHEPAERWSTFVPDAFKEDCLEDGLHKKWAQDILRGQRKNSLPTNIQETKRYKVYNGLEEFSRKPMHSRYKQSAHSSTELLVPERTVSFNVPYDASAQLPRDSFHQFFLSSEARRRVRSEGTKVVPAMSIKAKDLMNAMRDSTIRLNQNMPQKGHAATELEDRVGRDRASKSTFGTKRQRSFKFQLAGDIGSLSRPLERKAGAIRADHKEAGGGAA